MLKPLNCTGYSKDTVWCGPSAVATITGLSVKDATELVCSISNRLSYEDVSEIMIEEVLLALYSVGYISKQIDMPARFPGVKYGVELKRFEASRTIFEKLDPIICATTDHFFTIHMGWMCDNWTKVPVSLETCPHKNRHILSAYVVTKRLS